MNKVTIYIPTKNRSNQLAHAVNSVLSQTYGNWELIVINDASTDGTYNYLESIKSDKIKVIHQTESKGACVARNLAITTATGYFITGLDDDDFFHKDRLQKFIDAWNFKPEKYQILFTGRKEFFDNGEIKREVLPKYKTVKKKDLLIANFIGNQIFTKTEHLRSISGFDENLKMWQDIECWYRALSISDALNINNSSYYMNVSERADRISFAKLNKLNETQNYFASKHKLNWYDRKKLECNFIVYNPSLKLKIQKFLIMLFNGTFFKYVGCRIFK